MKRMVATLLALVMCLSLAACGSTPDKQPAINAYNQVSETYNKFAEVANANIEAFTDEDIEFFNGCADVLNEYADKLESNTEFTQAEIDEMVEMFNEFNDILEEFLAEF